MTARLPVVGSSAKSTAFVSARLDGPGGMSLYLDGNGKITAGNGTLHEPTANALSLPAAGISGIDHCPGSTPTCREACLASHHKVLTADLRYIPLKELQVGAQLVSFDEHLRPGSVRMSRRRFKTGTVTAIHQQEDEVFAVTLSSGKVFKVTRDHRWLTKIARSGNQRWQYTDELKPGTVIPKFVDEWIEDRSFEAGWLSGIYDGEGCYTVRSTANKYASRLVLSQKAGLVLERAKLAIESLLGRESLACIAQTRDVWQLGIRGGCRAVSRALGQLRPVSLLAKFRPEHLGELRGSEEDCVVSIVGIGRQEVTQVRIDCSTMIVEGYGHHNCYVGPLSRAQQELYAMYEHNARVLARILADCSEEADGTAVLTPLAVAWADELGAWIVDHASAGFRFHVSGDVVSLTHASWIAAVCRRAAPVRCWIYTRSFDLLAPLAEVSTLRGGNLAVNLSADRDNYAAARRAAHDHGCYAPLLGEGERLRICYLTVDGEVPDDLQADDVVFPDYNLRPRAHATLAESPWWQAISQFQRGLVCPVDAHGKSERNRCGLDQCSRCLK